MKQKLLLFLLALISSIGAWAETINLDSSSSFKNNANTTYYKNGVVQTAGVWCDKATQGYVILTGSLSSYDGKIEVLKNQETPKYLAKVKKALLTAWDGLSVKDAKAKQVDAVTGATFTSEAMIKNVQQGLDYYQKNK